MEKQASRSTDRETQDLHRIARTLEHHRIFVFFIFGGMVTSRSPAFTLNNAV